MLDDKVIGVRGDLSRIILQALKDFDYKNSTIEKLSKKFGKREKVLGVTCYDEHVIYVAKDQSDVQREITQLHEFAHVYLSGVGLHNLPEDEVDNIAMSWRRKIYESIRPKYFDNGDF